MPLVIAFFSGFSSGKVSLRKSEYIALSLRKMISNGQAGWAYWPDGDRRILVQKDTGLRILDADGKLCFHTLKWQFRENRFREQDYSDILRYGRDGKDPFEGKVDHVYLDSRGIPTVGTGINIKSPRVQADLVRQGYFILPDGGVATQENIANEIETLKQAAIKMTGKSHPAASVNYQKIRASAYAPYTSLTIDSNADDAHLLNEICKVEHQVTDGFPLQPRHFLDMPRGVQMALLDFEFNLGQSKFEGRLSKAKGEARRGGYPNMIAAIQVRDFARAAKEADRKGAAKSRVNTVKDWLRSAAQNTPFYIGLQSALDGECLQLQANGSLKPVLKPNFRCTHQEIAQWIAASC